MWELKLESWLQAPLEEGMEKSQNHQITESKRTALTNQVPQGSSPKWYVNPCSRNKKLQRKGCPGENAWNPTQWPHVHHIFRDFAAIRIVGSDCAQEVKQCRSKQRAANDNVGFCSSCATCLMLLPNRNVDHRCVHAEKENWSASQHCGDAG